MGQGRAGGPRGFTWQLIVQAAELGKLSLGSKACGTGCKQQTGRVMRSTKQPRVQLGTGQVRQRIGCCVFWSVDIPARCMRHPHWLSALLTSLPSRRCTFQPRAAPLIIPAPSCPSHHSLLLWPCPLPHCVITVLSPAPSLTASLPFPRSLVAPSCQVMNEGPGHVPLHKIPENMAKQLEWCAGVGARAEAGQGRGVYDLRQG